MRLLASATLMVCMIAASTWTWDALINNKLYSCTDGGTLDFLMPGDWVHHPITVNKIFSGHSMSEPDMIKFGWSVQRLWALWFCFVLFSLAVSFMAGFGWSIRRETEDMSQNANAE